MRIGKVCDLRPGFTARGRLEPVSEGGILAIQLRDVRIDASISVTELSMYDLGSLSDRYLARSGDVIFKSRGFPNVAAVVSDDLREPAVAMLPLITMRPKCELIIPGFLAWAINQPDFQRSLNAGAQGTNLRMIPKQVLEEIDIPLPALEKQRQIVSISDLARIEGLLLRELADRKRSLVDIALMKYAREAQE